MRWGALVHDLGKAVTPKDEWPHHHGHEGRGVPFVEAASERLKVPTELRRIGRLASHYHLHVHRALEMSPSGLVRLFIALDVRRRPETVEELVRIAEADARGRTGLERRDYPQAAYLLDLAREYRQVDSVAIVKRLGSGPAIADAIRAESVRRVARRVKALAESAAHEP